MWQLCAFLFWYCVKLQHIRPYTLFSLWAGCNKRSTLKLTDKTYNLCGHSRFTQVHITNNSSDYRAKESVFLCFVEPTVQNSCCIMRQLSAFSYGFTRNFTVAPFNLCSLMSSYLAKEENSRKVILLQPVLYSPWVDKMFKLTTYN